MKKKPTTTIARARRRRRRRRTRTFVCCKTKWRRASRTRTLSATRSTAWILSEILQHWRSARSTWRCAPPLRACGDALPSPYP